MLKTITAVAFAAIIGVGAQHATGTIEATGPQPSVKGDRLVPRSNGPACEQAAWPHYDSHCVRSQTQPGARPREVRIVAIDRLPSTYPAAPRVN